MQQLSKSLCYLVITLFFSLFATAAHCQTPAAKPADQKKEYVCPPCGCSNDTHSFAQPGHCASCGMALVEKGALANQPPSAPPLAPKRAVILIFDGVQIIDYTGPYEVFGQAGFLVYTAAVNTSPILTAMGMRVTPSHSLETAPQADVLIIPGGGVNLVQEDPAVIKWIQEQAKGAEHVLSVCNGAFILAKTGLLDGLTATTFYQLVDGLPTAAPKTRVVADQRYVDNGKIITTAGLSSGIDGSLYVVSKMRGKALAQMAALNMEYNWQPDSRYARASFADRHLHSILSTRLLFAAPAGTTLRVLSTAGDAEKWEVVWQVEGKTTIGEVIKRLSDKLVADGKWHLHTASASPDALQFTDQKGGVWQARITGQAVAGEAEKLTITLRLKQSAKQTPPRPESR